MSSRARIGAVALTLAAALAVSGAARADGDPASDVLYTGRVFLPYNTTIGGSAQKGLLRTVEAAEKAGYPIRVALIAAPVDLGAVTALWNRPRKYARFLGLELSFVYKGPLLIVMPSGFGFEHYKRGTASEYTALSPIPIAAQGDGLAAAAVTAVRRLSAAAGHPLAAGTSGGSGFWSSAPFLAAVIAVAVLVAAAGVALRLRRSV